MRPSIFGKWARTSKFRSYVLVPSLASLALMIMYFAGSSTLQSFVAPTLYGISPDSWTKIGLLEILQVVLLAGILFFSIRAFMTCQSFIPKLVIAALIGLTVFTLLQETDYGRHYRDFLNRPPTPVRIDPDVVFEVPEPGEGELAAIRISMAGNLLVLLALMVTPIFHGSRDRTLRLLAPSPWMTFGAISAGVLFWIAWRLNSRGFAIVDATQGHFFYEVVEFLQFSVYYLVLIWIAVVSQRAIYRP